MNASRRTQKLVMAARIIADVLHERMADVLGAYDAKGAYLEMKSMGFYWNQDLQTWFQKEIKQQDQRALTRTPVRAEIRIMCDDLAATESVRSYIMSLIEDDNGSIESVGKIADNRTSDGARAYFVALV